MGYERLKEVVEQCTNAWFNNSFRGSSEAIEQGLVSRRPIANEDRTEILTGWDLCPNLKEIRDDRPKEHHEIEAIFSTPKFFLTAVTIELYGTGDLRKYVDALAQSTC